MQDPFGGKQPLGVVYNTTMNRPDAALALALLYGFQGKREARVGSVCVNGSGFGAAVFCDVVSRFYMPGNRNGNSVLATGLAANGPLPADPPMITPAIERKTDKGDLQYARDIKKISDTSLPEAVIRNGVIFNAQAVMILSAPATCLAKSLVLLGTKQLYKERVKLLVVVDSGAPQDVPAIRQVLAEWPTPVVFCPKEVGDTLRFPAASIERDFAWAPANPVVDAYRAFQAMPYDAPSYDMAGILYAIHPDQGFFQLSDPGTISVGDDGGMKFTAGGGGRVRSLVVDPAQKEKVIQTFVEVASAKPPVPQQRVRPPQANAAGAAKPADVKPGDVKPGDVKPADVKPGEVKP